MSQTYDLSKYTIAQLKDYLRPRGLKLGGKKSELVARVANALAREQAGLPAKEEEPAVAVALPAQAGLPQAPLGYQAAALPTITTGKAPKSPKAASPKTTRAKVTPIDTLKAAAREADLSLGAAVAALFEVYGLDPGHVLGELGEEDELKPISLPVPNTEEGLMGLKVAELKKILKDMGQKIGGKKAELVQRILNPDEAQQETVVLPPAPTGDFVMPPVPDFPGATELPTQPGVPTDVIPEVPQVPQVAPGIPQVPTLPMVPTIPTVTPPQTVPFAAAFNMATEIEAAEIDMATEQTEAVSETQPMAIPTLDIPTTPQVPAIPTGLPVAPQVPTGLPTTDLPTTDLPTTDLPITLPTIEGAGSPVLPTL